MRLMFLMVMFFGIVREDNVSCHKRLVASGICAVDNQVVVAGSGILWNYDVVVMYVCITQSRQIVRLLEEERFVGSGGTNLVRMAIEIIMDLYHVAAQHLVVLEVALEVYTGTYKQFITVFWFIKFDDGAGCVGGNVILIASGKRKNKRHRDYEICKKFFHFNVIF